MKNWKFPAAGLLSVVILAAPFAVQAEMGEKSLANVSQNQQDNLSAAHQLTSILKPLMTIRADFIQQTIDNSGRKLEENTGNMIVKRPNFFRWDVTEPFPQLVVSNGEKVWLYDKDLEQVTIQKLDSQVNVTPALILSGNMEDITKNFTVSDSESDDQLMFTLNPKRNESMFETLQLTFIAAQPGKKKSEEKDWQLTRMLLTDSLGARTKIEFASLKFNEALLDKTFELYIPPGVDVIGDGQ